MKKLLFSAAFILLLLGSCSQNELVENVLSKGYNTVTATIEGQNDSRLSVQHNTSTNVFCLTWSAGDSFKVLGDSEGTLNWISGNEFGGTEPANPQYAIYPAANVISVASDVVTMTLSAEPSIENINLPMCAGAPTNDNYAFKHLAAALQFTLNDIPTGYNQLIVKASKPISGEFTAALNATEPKLVSTSTTEVDKKVTVGFTATTSSSTQNKVFYIPLPTNTYESLEVSVSDGTNTKELKSWTNLEVVRGKMYYTTATVDATTIEAVNDALANAGEKATVINLTAAIDASAGDVNIPDAAENVTMDFGVAPATTDEHPLTINQNAGETSGDATGVLNINMPVGATDLYAEINTPTTTVTLNGGSYKKVTATTAINTLVIGEGVTIEELIILGGNIKLEGNLTLGKPLEVNQDLELDLGGHTLASSENNPDNFSSVIMVYGGNLTIKNGTVATSGENAHKYMAALWLRSKGDNNNAANVTIGEDVVLKGSNWNQTGDTDCMATVYVSNPNGFVTINGGEFYCGRFDEQPEGINQLLNYKNAFTTQNIVVKGGTFHGMNPAKGNGVEVSYLAENYISYQSAEGEWTVASNTTSIEISSEAALLDIASQGGIAVLAADLTLSNYVEVRDTDLTVRLNGKTITHPATSGATYKDVFEVYGNGKLTIEGEGSVIAEDGYSVYAAGNSVVTLNGGCYFSPVSAVDARKNAVVTINGGEFKVDGTNNPDGDFGQQYTLNLRDKKGNYASELANIIVKGGTFYKYNPAESHSEDPVANFVAEGYISTTSDNGETYVVTKE